MKKLYRRLLDICYENKLHHLGSYFSCLHIIDSIYKNKEQDDIFILSNGHAVVALYVILEPVSYTHLTLPTICSV